MKIKPSEVAIQSIESCKKNYSNEYHGRFWVLQSTANFCTTTVKIIALYLKLAVIRTIDFFHSFFSRKNVKEVFPTHTKDGMPIMDPQATGLLYRMQKEFDDVCSMHGIRYIACSGTTLGIIRQNPPGIIPWDDDIDLALFLGEENKFTPAFHEDLKKRGIRLRKHWGGFKLTLLECPQFGKKYGPEFGIDQRNPKNEGDFYWPFIDLFVLYKNSEDGNLYINSEGFEKDPDGPSTLWPREHWVESDLENRKRVPFGPIMIPIAENAETYVKRAYGDDCLTSGIQIFDHKEGRPFPSPKKIRLTDLAPAPYDSAYFKTPLPGSAT